MPHICVSELGQHCSDHSLSPDRSQAIIWSNAGLLLIGHLGTNFSEIWIKIKNFSFMKMHFEMSSGKWQPFCPGEDELRQVQDIDQNMNSQKLFHTSPVIWSVFYEHFTSCYKEVQLYLKFVQSGAIIKWSNITYFIQYCNDLSRIWIRV